MCIDFSKELTIVKKADLKALIFNQNKKFQVDIRFSNSLI